ncbi:MAG TPA: ROK family protein [Candidatus Marinimicrobia bacterium]|nr:ROK family protein [Candidatus Neomarinimicrobiota bacterium]
MRIGIDLGGTKVSIGLVDQNRLIGQPVRFMIAECKDADDLVKHMKDAIDQSLKANGIVWQNLEMIGIGSPGPLDYKTGIILHTPNLVMLRNYPLGPKLEALTGLPVLVNNDANCFALGEQRAGGGRGLEYVLGVTLGTGFGLGFIYRSEIFNGATGTALEFAMTPYLDGVYEDYISGRGLARIYKSLVGKEIKPAEVTALAKKGDADALETWRIFGHHLAQAMIVLVMVLDPDIIVIGGSVSQGWDFFYQTLETELRAGIHAGPAGHLKITRSQLGELAAIIGAASL